MTGRTAAPDAIAVTDATAVTDAPAVTDATAARDDAKGAALLDRSPRPRV
ncbi:hypothetical protein [Streptomyces sp. NEAU-H3]|nr:hypothetical protein [Streptomyces sp. NEAU-H3]NJA55384.1 hypothetical protein [Streptomyces sp. NEAU-H3]